MVSPWLATSISRQRATYQLPSLLTAAVSVRARSTFLGYWASRHLLPGRARVGRRSWPLDVTDHRPRCDSNRKLGAGAARRQELSYAELAGVRA
jgi:hypothetical protein